MADLMLGAPVDPATGERVPDQSATLPASELTTHGVIVGMTGSGKTGLAVVLIEECLRAGVPALLVDPKGDLTNLCLMFPALAPADFEPWVNDGDAQKAGQSVPDFAATQAQAWRDGLAGWSLGPEQISDVRARVDFRIYTPGSTAGTPINIVGSLQAPKGVDPEVMQDEIDGYVTSLLGMLGITADPLSSREHILLSNLINNAWTQGHDLDLPTVLAQVQQPPMRKLGVLELDVFFPPNDRMAFAMRLNGLLASPGFQTWLAGDPVDIASMLFTPEGRPRCAIVTTAHLSDEDRQSVTSLLLAKLVTWMRRQSGTSDLRALLYMDEVAGYLPPTANPPTKKPIMTLLKQARAFGLGVVLATQNPVDVDYKALSNAGTWLVGRLQTEQDKNRLMDGLSSATGGVDVNAVSTAISGLGKRQFLMRRSGKDAPTVMTSRWAMSYLRGPLTRDQISSLAKGPRTAAPAAPSAPPAAVPTAAAQPADSTAVPVPDAPAVVSLAAGPVPPPAASAPESPAGAAAPTAGAESPWPGPPPVAGPDETPVAPAAADGTAVSYLDPAAAWAAGLGAANTGHYRAGAVARVHLRYKDAKADLLHDEEYEAVLFPMPQQPDATGFVSVDYDDRDLLSAPPGPAVYGFTDAGIDTKTWWTTLKRSLTDTLVRTQTAEVFVNTDLKLFSRIGESQADFLARCTAAADAAADQATAALQQKYEAKVSTVRSKAQDAAADANSAQAQYDAEFGVGATVVGMLGGLFGGRRGRSSVAAQARRQSTANAKVGTAQTKAQRAADAVGQLEAELAAEVAELDGAWMAKAGTITTRSIALARSNVTVADLRLVWIPVG